MVHYSFLLQTSCLILKCMLKAYNSTLSNCIEKKCDLSYSIRARDSLLVPRFNTRFMKGSVAYRATLLWNIPLTSNCTDPAHTGHCNLAKKLRSSELLRPLNSTYYQLRPRVLNLFEIKLICFNIALIAFQYALNCIYM